MYLTAAMTGMRIGQLQAFDWRSVDMVHARIRVRRTWDRKTKTFTAPKSRRSERAIPMPDEVAGELERTWRHYHPDAVEPHPDALVFADPTTREPLGWRRMYERLREALTAAGLDPAFGWHSLRHSYGTALAAEGVPMRTCRSGSATRTSRPHSGTPTTARTPRSATSSPPRSPEVPITGPICGAPYGTERN
jgi:integrase